MTAVQAGVVGAAIAVRAARALCVKSCAVKSCRASLRRRLAAAFTAAFAAAFASAAAMPDWSPPRRRGRSLLSRYKLSVNGTELNKTQQVLQKIFKDARYELFVIMLVLMYAGITLISIMDQDLIANVPLLAVIFWLVDIIFCGIFVIELWLKIYAFGLPHFKNPLEFLDAVVIIVSVGLVIAEQAAIFDGHTAADESENHGSSAAAAMRLLRVGRLFLVVCRSDQRQTDKKGRLKKGSVSNKAYIYRMCMFTFVLGILFVIQARARARNSAPLRRAIRRNSLTPRRHHFRASSRRRR